MSELSTADLAGGGTTRPRTDERTRPMDPATDTRRHPDQTDEGLGMTGRQADLTDDADDLRGRPTSGDATFTPSSTATTRPSTGASGTTSATPLFPSGEAESFRSRWMDVQTGFVDEPRHAVEQADGLVAEMMKRLAQVFAEERAGLEEQWSRGDDISTEDLRVALQRYRSFFDRLLSV